MEVRTFGDPESLFQDLAADVQLIGRTAFDQRGLFQLVLNGGSTPRGLFEVLRSGSHRRSQIWRKTRFYWGDERCVQPDSTGSNYRLAREELLDPLGISPHDVHRIKCELGAQAAADDYARLLRKRSSPGLSWPRFDLVLLGLVAVPLTPITGAKRLTWGCLPAA